MTGSHGLLNPSRITVWREHACVGRYFQQGVTKDLSESVIRHSIEYCDYLISEDDSLDGTMYDLQTELSATPTDIVVDIEADMDPFQV